LATGGGWTPGSGITPYERRAVGKLLIFAVIILITQLFAICGKIQSNVHPENPNPKNMGDILRIYKNGFISGEF
jgi:hypothetical protein